MELGAVELSLNELIYTEAGGFWKTLGYIVGIIAVAAVAYYAPVVVAFLK